MGDIHVIPDGALLITDGVIRHAGPTRRLERLAEARRADAMDVAGRVVMPGFVDCFTQLLCGPPRIADENHSDSFDAAARIYRSWSAQRLEMEGRKRLRQFVRFGTTTVAGASGYGLDEETELRSLRVMDRLRAAPVELAPMLYTTSRARLGNGIDPWDLLEALATALLPAAHAKRLLTGVVIGDGFPHHAVEGFLACAAKLGMRALVETGGDAVELACRLSRIDAVLGLEQLAPPQTPLLAASSVLSVLLPGRTFHGGRHSYAPARALIDQGGAVALATGYDSLASPTASMPMVMALACTQMRMTPEEALTATTVNAAQALGMGGRAGSLQSGMQADLLVMDCGDYREIPLYFGMNPVALVMRRGQVVFPRVEATTELGPIRDAGADRVRS